MKKTEFAQRLNEVDEKLKDQFAQIEKKLHHHSDQLEQVLSQLNGKGKHA